MQDFIHLNVHSHYSILKSTITIPSAVDKAIADGQRGMALTDDGVMYGIKEFVDYCATTNKKRKKEELEPFKPIIGCEMFVAPRTMQDKEEGDDRCSRLIVLAKNLKGYKNLIKLVSGSWTEGLMNETPRTDFFELEKYHEGLIICSSCLNGIISKRILSGDIEGARKAIVWFKHVWGNDFYMEIQRHEVTDSTQRATRKVYPLQQSINNVLVELTKELNVKLVCSNNCHFIDEDDAEALDRLYCLAADKDLDDPKRKLCTKQEWLKTRGEMNSVFSDMPAALSNTLEILDKVELYGIENDILLPIYPIPSDFVSEADYLVHLAYLGAKKKYGEILPESVKARLDYELNVINTVSFPGYFLFVQDYVNAAQKEIGVWVGPGRGSAVGSLVNYCLGITKVDPLKHGLLFERFLNPDRRSLPDIDIDLDVEGREKVLKWIKEKYGGDNCAHIITFGTMSALKYSSQLEGIVGGTGIHACGFIISPDAVANHVPVATVDDPCNPERKTLITQYDGHVIESTGLVKFDFLGLRTLSVIKECLHLIKQNRGIDVDINNIPLDDEKTFKLYQEGRTVGTFHFESDGMQKYLRELKPTAFEDLVAIYALYHPGPMNHIPSFIVRKNGREAITYDLPVMERYLKETYGVTVYQEQIMRLVRDIAGFSRGESDAVRKALHSSRHYAIWKAFKEKFIEGGKTNGYNPDILEKIWNDWEKFGMYAFNKSHAVAYTQIAYQTAYLKAIYPIEYMAAILTTRCHYNEKDRIKLMDECKAMGIHVLPPSVNESDEEFSVDGEGNILFGLCSINGIYEDAAFEIIDERNSGGSYKDIYDFAKRVNRSICDKETFELLVKCGAFDCFGLPREQYFGKSDKGRSSIDLIFDYALVDPMQELFEVDQPILPIANISALEKYLMEREVLEFNFSPHPIESFREIYADKCNAKCDALNHLYDFEDYTYIVVAGLVTDIKTCNSIKTNGEHAIITIEDESGKADLTLRNNVWSEYKNTLTKYHPIVIRGYTNISLYNSFIVEKVYDLETQKIDVANTLNADELNKSKLSVKVTCAGCFSGVQKPVIFIEGTPQFLFWLDIYKEGLQKPNYSNYTDVELYRGDELIGSIRGYLDERQLQRLCDLQRETDDLCGYHEFLRTQEEREELLQRHDSKEISESTSLLNVKDFDDSDNSSENGNDDLPF